MPVPAAWDPRPWTTNCPLTLRAETGIILMGSDGAALSSVGQIPNTARDDGQRLETEFHRIGNTYFEAGLPQVWTLAPWFRSWIFRSPSRSGRRLVAFAPVIRNAESLPFDEDMSPPASPPRFINDHGPRVFREQTPGTLRESGSTEHRLLELKLTSPISTMVLVRGHT